MISKRTLLILVAGFALAYGDMLLRFASRLWGQDHYQFFPIFLIAVFALVIERVKTDGELPSGRFRIGPISFGLFLLALIAAVTFRSPLLGFVSFFLCGFSLLCAFPLARGAWSMLAILIPPPLGLDGRIIHQLQHWSSVGASRVLDQLSVPHLMEGNVLHLADRRLLVAEACSGLGSVFLVAAATLFWLVYTRERLSRGILLFASSFWWSMASNVVRIVLIAVAHDWWSIDLATGLVHQILGVLTMLLALAGTASTAMLLRFLLSAISDEKLQEDKSLALTPIALWNLFTTTNRALVYRVLTPLIKVDIRPRQLANAVAVVLMVAGVVYWSQPSIAGFTTDLRKTAGRILHQDGDAVETLTREESSR